MKVQDGRLPGIKIIEPQVFGDARGFFVESYNEEKFQMAGITCDFVQDNHSRSVKNTLRGLHYQLGLGQAKLIRVVSGEVLDVVVDIRHDSPTFGQSESFLVSAENQIQVFVPVGFAHGFSVLSENADFIYKVSSYYAPDLERGIRFDDPELGIDWRVKQPVLSTKDKLLPTLAMQTELL